MENYQGATIVKEETTDSFTEMGKRLTAEAARRLPGKCISCGSVEGTQFLIHLSVNASVQALLHRGVDRMTTALLL